MRHWDPSNPGGDKVADHMRAHCKEVDWVQMRRSENHGEEGGDVYIPLSHVRGLLTPHIAETRIEDQSMGCEEALGRFAKR